MVNVSNLSTIVEIKTDKKQSIFYQVMSRFTRFYSSSLFTTWATKHAQNQPQLPFIMIRYGEQAMVALALAACNHSVTSAIDDKNYSAIPMRHYKQAVLAFDDYYKAISALIRSETRIATIPESCPDEYNPKVIARKRMRADVTREVAASLAPRPNAGRHAPAAAAPAPGPPRQANGNPTTATQPGTGRGAGRGGRGGAWRSWRSRRPRQPSPPNL